MKTNLRPCPFCGKKRHLRFEPFEGSTDTGIVVCICGASYTTIEQGADWNTRPIEDTLNKRIVELEALVERLIEVFEKGKDIRLIPDPEINKIQEWAYKLKILVTEWKERE